MHPLRPTPSPRRCVLLFARADVAEARAKGFGTRGAALFAALRARIARAAEAVGADLVVVGAAGGGAARHVLRQRGLDFGSRLRAAFEDARGLGYQHIVSVGLDTPRLGPSHLEAAFSALMRAPAVLGPSPDGGVYLLGCADVDLAAFERVRWLGRHVTRDLARGFTGAVRLEALADIDRADDAARLCLGDDALFALACAGRVAKRPGAPLRLVGRIVSAAAPIRGPPAL